MSKNKTKPNNYRQCPYCRHIHDGSLSICPRCNQTSEGELLPNRFPNVIQVHWVKQILMFLIGWGGLSLVSLLISLFFIIYANNTYPDPIANEAFLNSNRTNLMLNLFTYSTLFVGLIALLWKDLIRVLKSFKPLRNIVVGLSYGGLVIVAAVAYNLVILAFGYEMSDNQNESAIVAMMSGYPIMSFLAFVLFGPIVEEITYRLGLFSLIRRLNRPLAYVVTMLVFGLIHMSFNPDTILNELINLPSYILAGTILTIAYEKEGFAVSTYAHITNNLISFLLTIIEI